MTTVNTTRSPLNQFTWDTATFAWTDNAYGKLTWDTVSNGAFSVAIAESVACAEQPSKEVDRPLAEAFAVGDSYVKNHTGSVAELLKFAENVNYLGSFGFIISEHITFSEVLGKNPTIPFAESFSVGIGDAFNTVIGKGIEEALAVEESMGRTATFLRSLAESLQLADPYSKYFYVPKSEVLHVAESHANLLQVAIAESMSFAEAAGRLCKFYRSVAEGLNLQEAVGNAVAMPIAEAVTFFDGIQREANMVLSDMLLAQGDMTLADFAAVMTDGNAPGFGPWQTFAPGDYTYQNALFRAIVSSTNSDRGLLEDIQVTVDIPDVNDRGTATITDAANGITVSYNKKYNIIPEIQLTAYSGTGNPAVAMLNGSPTASGFTAILRDTVTGANVTGTFTWAAHGY